MTANSTKTALLATLLLCAITISARSPLSVRTTRKQLTSAAATINYAPNQIDTLAVGQGAIVMSGYDKPLRSNRETAFFTNNTNHHVAALVLNITYLDAKKRTLHKRRQVVKCSLPAGETRQLAWTSWDRQQSFVYALSRKPRVEASTYDITCSIDSIHTLSR